MTRILLFPLCIFFIFSCSKDDSSFTSNLSDDIEINSRNSKKVSICHKGKIINVSINAVPAHQAHGDAIDMDGDGFFDINNPCGPRDCDDNNENLGDNCIECGFCPNMHLWDFDESCYNVAGEYMFGDRFCIKIDDIKIDVGGCGYRLLSYSISIFDEDESDNTCQDDNENDKGFIQTLYYSLSTCDEVIVGGGYSYGLIDKSTGADIIPYNINSGTGQEYYDLGLYCANIIRGIISDFDIPENCDLVNRIMPNQVSHDAIIDFTENKDQQSHLVLDFLNIISFSENELE